MLFIYIKRDIKKNRETLWWNPSVVNPTLSFPFALDGTSNKEMCRLEFSKKLKLDSQMPSILGA